MVQVVALQPDALIVSDPGIVMLLRQHFPEQALHLSVQANTVNWAALKFWQQQGIERVILSRELSLQEIKEMREHVPDMELEVFVHGALCMAYSGRCLLSGYTNKRDPNRRMHQRMSLEVPHATCTARRSRLRLYTGPHLSRRSSTSR